MRKLVVPLILLAFAGCSSDPDDKSNNTIGAPITCAASEDCNAEHECARLDSDEGPTEKICVEAADCGELTCDSGRCGKSPEGGEPSCIVDEESSGPGACEGKVCGDSCSTCEGEVCPTVEEYCQPDGSCSANADFMCDADPCADKACGDSCSTCDPDGELSCPAVEEYCQPDGSCTSDAAPMCADAYDPCAAKMCGDSCTVCDPADPDCAETAVEKFCDPDGMCVAGAAAC